MTSIDKKAFFGASKTKFRGNLNREFLYTPISVLDARQGQWVNRKQMWINDFRLKGELGRTQGSDAKLGRTYSRKLDGFGKGLKKLYDKKEITTRSGLDKRFSDNSDEDDHQDTSVSVFDPVLCELCYTWFCPNSGSIFDPFAGGATRGIVAEALGYDYTGIEIRPEQVRANEAQAKSLVLNPTWIEGDSQNLDKLLRQNGMRNKKFDLCFSCPPYYDLEVYSEGLSGEGSAYETYDEFLVWYNGIYEKAVARLAENRFFVIVVGEIRDKKTGIYRNFVGDTIRILNGLDLQFYNEMVLITRGGSLRFRVGRQFRASRKVGKSHQNVLVFFKGDVSEIKNLNFKKAVSHE